MNHGGMDHGGMDHGGMGHGGMDHGSASHCSMNMVWNYDTTNLCILSSSWRITTPFSLYLSLSIIALSAILYEYLRLYIRRLDSKLARSSINSLSPVHHRRRASLLPTSSSPSNSSGGGGLGISDRRTKRRSSNTSLDSISSGRDRWVKPLETTRRMQVWRSTLYATSMGVSFALMLISMTFNAYVIGAIVFGAGMGHYLFNRDVLSNVGVVDDQGLACHT